MRRMIGVLVRRCRQHREGGFTMVETLIAITVMAATFLGLAYTATIGFSYIGFARQRQGATGLVNQAVEQAKAVPFDTLKKGLSSNDPTLATDASITACGANKCYGGEQIPLSGYAVGTVITPLVPHQRTVVVGATTYTVSTYVTYYLGVTTSNAFRITAVATWTNPQRNGVPAKVTSQTVAFSPSGCLSTATHPFAAPCQPFLYGTASVSEGHIDVSGTVEDLDVDHATIWTPDIESNMQVEQVTAVSGTAITSGTSLQEVGSAELARGRKTAVSGADNDPAQADPEYQSVATPAQVGGSQTVVGSWDSLTTGASTGDSGNSTSTISATVSPSQPCPNITGMVNETDAQPCGGSTATQAGTNSTTLTMGPGGSDLGSAILAQIAAPPSASRAITYRDVVPDGAVCGTTTGDGCLHGEAFRSLGTVNIGGLLSKIPGAQLPLGWNNWLVRVTGYSDSVSEEVGVGTAAPLTSAAGTLTYYTGAGYATCTVYVTCPVGSLPASQVHVVATVNGDLILVDVVPTLKVGTQQTTSTTQTCTPTPCPNNRTSATASVYSPISGDISYTVTRNGVVVASLNIHVDLGSLLAQGTYQPSPSGA